MPLELLVAAPPDLLLVGEIPAARRHAGRALVQHRALRKLPSLTLGVSGALHVLLRADDHRRSRRPRARTRRHPCSVLARRPHDDNATLGHAVAARTRGTAHRRVHRRRAHRARLERLALPRMRSGARSCSSCDCRARCSASSIGAALGLAGAAMQGYLRNPLADPGTLGISSMAAFGAVLSIFFGIADLHPGCCRRAASPARSSAWPRCSCSPA